jgi:hypothetical protein
MSTSCTQLALQTMLDFATVTTHLLNIQAGGRPIVSQLGINITKEP